MAPRRPPRRTTGASVSVSVTPIRRGRGSVSRRVRAARRSTSPARIPPRVTVRCSRLDAGGERDQHRQRPDEVGRGDLHQDAALDRALVGHVELGASEVAQPAVDELGAPPAGAEGHVVRVDGHHVEPAGGGVEGHPRAGDAEPDHEHVGALGQVVEADGEATPVMAPGSAAPAARARRRGRPRRRRGPSEESTMVCAESVNPWQASSSERARRSGSPARTEPPAWPSPDEVGEHGGDRLLAAPSAVEQVGQQQLGVDVEDPAQQLVGAQAADRGDHACGDPVERVAVLRCIEPGGLADDAAPLPGHQVGQHRLHVRPPPVERHPADPGAAGHVGERRTAPADGQDRLAGGVEVGVVGPLAKGVVLTVVTMRRHVSHCNT